MKAIPEIPRLLYSGHTDAPSYYPHVKGLPHATSRGTPRDLPSFNLTLVAGISSPLAAAPGGKGFGPCAHGGYLAIPTAPGMPSRTWDSAIGMSRGAVC